MSMCERCGAMGPSGATTWIHECLNCRTGWCQPGHVCAGDVLARVTGERDEARRQVEVLTTALTGREPAREDVEPYCCWCHKMFREMLDAAGVGVVQPEWTTMQRLDHLIKLHDNLMLRDVEQRGEIDDLKKQHKEQVNFLVEERDKAEQLLAAARCAVCKSDKMRDEQALQLGVCSGECAKKIGMLDLTAREIELNNQRHKKIQALEAERDELHKLLEVSDHKAAHHRAQKLRQQVESFRQDRDEQKKIVNARLEQLNRQGVAFGEQLADLREENARLKKQVEDGAKCARGFQQGEDHEKWVTCTAHSNCEPIASVIAPMKAEIASLREENAAFQQEAERLRAELAKTEQEGEKAPMRVPAVCETCNDTHRMHTEERGDVPCTRCPVPCRACQGAGQSAYCATTPCACACHERTKTFPPSYTELKARVDRKKYEHVNHPKHYNKHPSGREAIELCEHLSFCLGNAIKYLFRAGHKGAEKQDLQKAAWYLARWRDTKIQMMSDQNQLIHAHGSTTRSIAIDVLRADMSSLLGKVLDRLLGSTMPYVSGTAQTITAMVENAAKEAK